MNFKIWPPLTSLDGNLLSRIRLACVYGRNVILVTEEDEVLACGTNDSGCLGLEDTAPRLVPETVTALNKKRVKGFVFGGQPTNIFVVAYTYTGAIYVWGRDPGTGAANPILKPTLIDQLPVKVKEVSCGIEHILVMSIHGEVFSWGNDSNGQLGINTDGLRIGTPTKVAGELTGKNVVKICCGAYFSVAIVNTGAVYTWGCNDKGTLGINNNVNSLVPVRVSNLNDKVIRKIACGHSHVLAISDVGELFVWGSNEKGELGVGDNVSRLVPVKNETVGKVTSTAASFRCSTSAVLNENFKVFMWGDCAGLNLVVPKEMLYDSLHEVFANFSTPCHMYKPMTKQLGYESMNETIKNAFGDKESSDLIILAEGKEILVHRAILKLRSEYFRVLLQEHWIVESETCISLNQSYNALYAYLQYLYNGELKADPILALELIGLADEYNDRLLKKLCEKTIQHGITVDNVATLYAIALKLDGKKLLKTCMSFAANHMSELVDSKGFYNWDVKTMREFFIEARKKNLFRS